MLEDKIASIFDLAKELQDKKLKEEYTELAKMDATIGSFDNYKKNEMNNKIKDKNEMVNDVFVCRDDVNKDNLSVGMYLINYEHIEPIKLDDDYKTLPLDKKTIFEYGTVISFLYKNQEFNISGMFGGTELSKDSAINKYNELKKYICESILKYNPSIIGIYRLTMKKDSTNFRESAILDIIKEINKENKKVRIIIYEPLLHINSFNGFEIVNDFNVFQEQSDIIVANRVDEKLKNNKKVYTRDIYNIN